MGLNGDTPNKTYSQVSITKEEIENLEAVICLFLRKRFSENMQQIYRKTPMSKCCKKTLVWVFSCKSAAYFQNIYSEEHLWMAASVNPSLVSVRNLTFMLMVMAKLLYWSPNVHREPIGSRFIVAISCCFKCI